ncbi:MAG TPA: hypothetical protein VE733_09730 [Streptosporangiaceae bacterium]|jgi:hypothetical protein|nr:hypothetical protein [Streptosporangiaceae bacterium]
MKTGICLFWIAVGAILTFAVTANTSVFNLHIAGFVIMVIGIIGLATPKRGYEWLGRRTYVKRYRRALGGGRVEERSYPPYVLENPGTANAQADIPDVPSLEPDPEVARMHERHAATPAGEMATGRATIHGADRLDDTIPGTKKKVPGDTEVVEDLYEEE